MTPAAYWKQVREACAAKSKGAWWLSEQDGSIQSDDGHVSDNDMSDGDEAFVVLASEALPLALDEIDRLAKIGNDLSHEVNDAYERGVREGATTARAWSKARIEELEAALEKAADDLENAVSYVPEYFQYKWEMADDIKSARAALRKP